MTRCSEVFDFFVELGVPKREIRCILRQQPYAKSPCEYDVKIYGETAISFNTGFFWVPQFVKTLWEDKESTLGILGMTKCQGPWKDEFMKILPNFNKYIRQ